MFAGRSILFVLCRVVDGFQTFEERSLQIPQTALCNRVPRKMVRPATAELGNNQQSLSATKRKWQIYFFSSLNLQAVWSF
jgi:hypothetical protein